jgi:hypothetical protein
MREMPTSHVPDRAATPRAVGAAAPERAGAAASVRGPTASRASRGVPILAIASIAALALLVPTAPLLGLLLVAAILGGTVAFVLRHGGLERDEGATLDDLSGAGYVVLHDRAAPGFAGTVRRLVIGPTGVHLVEVVDVAGRVRVRGDAIVVGGRSLALGPRLQGQLRAVSSALAPQLTASGARVTPLICMRRAELPVLRRSVAGIPLLREGIAVRRIVSAPTVMDAATVALIADLARSTMPPVGRLARDEDDAQRTTRRSMRGVTPRSGKAADGAAEPLTEAPSPA